jgi:hypothetical protein
MGDTPGQDLKLLKTQVDNLHMEATQKLATTERHQKINCFHFINFSQTKPNRIKKITTNKNKVTTMKPNNASPSKSTLAIYAMSLTGLGMLVLSGIAIWSFSHTSCDGTVIFKASANGAEFAYNKTNCYPAQPQQASK